MAGEALQNAADAIMGGGIVGARVTVSCADGRPDRAVGAGGPFLEARHATATDPSGVGEVVKRRALGA